MKALKSNRLYKEPNTFLKIARSKQELILELSSEELYQALLKKLKLGLDSSLISDLNSENIKTLLLQGIKSQPRQTASADSDHICISVSSGLEILRKSDILHCEADNSYCKIYMKNEKTHLVSKTLKSILARLNSDRFIRLHQSHAVHLSSILRITKKDGLRAILLNGSEVPVSRSYKSELMDQLNLV